MKCTRIRKLISLYIDGRLNRRNTELVARHLQECSTCNEIYWQTQTVIRLAKEHFTEVAEPSAELYNKVMAEYRKTKVLETKLTQGWNYLPYVAAGFAVILLVFFLNVIGKIIKGTPSSELVVKEKIQPATEKNAPSQLAIKPESEPEPKQKQSLAAGKTEPKTKLTPVTGTRAAKETEKEWRIVKEQDKVQVPVTEVSNLETILIASVQIDDIQDTVVRGAASEEIIQQIKNRVATKIQPYKLAGEELTPEIKKVLVQRGIRLPTIQELKQSGLIGESNTAKLTVLDKETVTSHDMEIIDRENQDREILIQYYTQQYLEHLKLNPEFKPYFEKEIRKTFTTVMHDLTPTGSKIQLPDGNWVTK